jgi:hypothetical protein
MNLFFANESVFLLTSLSFCYRVCLSLNKPVLRQQDFHSINEPTHEPDYQSKRRQAFEIGFIE